MKGPRTPLSSTTPSTKFEDPRPGRCGERVADNQHRASPKALRTNFKFSSRSSPVPLTSSWAKQGWGRDSHEVAPTCSAAGKTNVYTACASLQGKFIKATLADAPGTRARGQAQPLLSTLPPEARFTDRRPSPVTEDRRLGLLRSKRKWDRKTYIPGFQGRKTNFLEPSRKKISRSLALMIDEVRLRTCFLGWGRDGYVWRTPAS